MRKNSEYYETISNSVSMQQLFILLSLVQINNKPNSPLLLFTCKMILVLIVLIDCCVLGRKVVGDEVTWVTSPEQPTLQFITVTKALTDRRYNSSSLVTALLPSIKLIILIYYICIYTVQVHVLLLLVCNDVITSVQLWSISALKY